MKLKTTKTKQIPFLPSVFKEAFLFPGGPELRTKPYEFIGFGAIDVTKPYEFIGFGAIDVTKPYEFIGFGAIDVTKPYEIIGFGAIDVTKPGAKFGRKPATKTDTNYNLCYLLCQRIV